MINPVPREAIDPWVRSMATTFLRDPSGESLDGWIAQLAGRWQPERAWGVRDRDRWVATLRTEPRRLTVPAPAGGGRELDVDALTNVTVAATHRRRGLMSQMLAGSLSQAKERGEALSVLIPAEWQIYGRFGYAPATLSCDYTLQRGRAGARCDGDLEAVRQVDVEQVAEVVSGVFDAGRREWPGQMDRGLAWWRRNLGLEHGPPQETPAPNWFVHEARDGIDGVLGWSPEGDPSLEGPAQHVNVQVLTTASDTAYRDLWCYLTSIDLVDEVRLLLRPVHEPARWLLDDPRTLVPRRQVDFLWLRFLDVPAALSARTYAVDGELVLEVDDPHAGGPAQGRYRLVAHAAGATCEPTNAEPDLEVTQRALASAYLGGFRLAELSRAGGARERTPGALSRADLMFSWPRPPWNPTWF